MDDGKGLDLSLGLPCGGGSSTGKEKVGSSSDTKSDDRGSKLINDFKVFLEGGTQRHDPGLGSQRSDTVKVEENFFTDASGAAVDVEASRILNSGSGVNHDSTSNEVDGENRSNVGNKRKSFFSETSQQKKQEKEIHRPDLLDKSRASHISINTDEGSTADNEDVADSELEGSSSRLVSRNDEGSKRFAEPGGQKRFNVSSEKEFSQGNMPTPYGVPFPPQAVNTINMPYSLPMKDSNPSGTPSSSSYSLPAMMQAMATTNNERPVSQPLMPAGLPLMFGYTPVQIPTLDKDNSRGITPHHQQLQASYFGRSQLNSNMQNDGLKITQGVAERARDNGKQHVGGDVSTSHAEDLLTANNMIHRARDASDQPRTTAFPSEFPAIRPGIAADLKFGGCGSYPNLPWVSTTGSGPNGRTISGVTYRFSPTQIRIVCACHGSHLSPEEFIRHAGEEHPSPDAIAPFSSSNPAASAQS